MAKVLFVYPNRDGYPMVPVGISVMAGILKDTGHRADLFDTTFMTGEYSEHDERERLNLVEKTDISQHWGKGKRVDIKKSLLKKIEDFRPDIIAFSILENNYGLSKELFSVVRAEYDVPIIVGGIFPTTAANFFVEDRNVDIICIGEGERAMRELADRIKKKEDFSNIPNLIVKKGGGLVVNKLEKFYDWKPPIFQDWSIFDQRHLMKPFMGRVWKAGFFELSRGCPYNCTYCINRFYQDRFKELGKYHREKPMDFAIKEIVYLKKKYGLEIVWFQDENFCLMSQERFREFCLKYKKEVGLPFFIQTRVDTLNEKKVKMLKGAGCITISVGVETGDEQTRKRILNKYIKNKTFLEIFRLCRKYDIRTTANFIIGLPGETLKDIMTTVSFCRECEADSIGLAIFAPYYGTKLRDECVRRGFMENRYYDNISFHSTILEMPQISKEQIEELYYKFSDLTKN